VRIQKSRRRFGQADTTPLQGLGWAGTKNGDLLNRAGGVTDIFVTMDGKLEHQHDISVLPFGVVVVDAPSNRMSDLMPLVPEMLAALEAVRPAWRQARSRAKLGSMQWRFSATCQRTGYQTRMNQILRR
jgi:hypothetical protein